MRLTIKRIIIVLYFVNTLSIVYAQKNKIDSLKQELNNEVYDTTRVRNLNELAYELSYGSKEKAIILAKEAMLLSEKLKYNIGIANTNDIFGIIYLDQGILDSAQFFFLKALKYYERQNDKYKIVTSYQKLGQVHAYRNSFDQAFEYYNREYELAVAIGDYKLIGNANNDLGTFYINQGWNMLDNENDTINFINYFKKGMPYILEAIRNFKLAKYDKGVALAYANLSLIEKASGNLEGALNYMRKAVIFFSKMDYKIYLVSAYNQFNQIFQETSQFDSAYYYINKSLALAKEIESNFDIRNAYGQIANLYENLGDFEQALYHHQLYDDINQTILNENKQKSIDEMEVKYQTEKHKLDLANQKNINQYQKLMLILAALLLFVMAIFALILFYRSKSEHRLNILLEKQKNELKDKNVEIKLKNDLLEESYARLKEANQEQNNLMAIVAHDLRSPLNMIKGLTELTALSGPLNEEQKEIAAKTNIVVENGISLISDIIKLKEYDNGVELNRKTYDLNDLLPVFVEAHSTYAQRKNISIHFRGIDKPLLLDTDYILFSRIIDNIISNAIKFSPFNKEVMILLEEKEGHKVIKIIDHGPGMNNEDLKHAFKQFKKLSARPTGGEKSSGLGLSIVKTLMNKLGGSIHIESELGKGTTFILKF